MTFRLAALASIACVFCVSSVNAFPKMPAYLVDGYKNEADYKPFIDKVTSLETKCDVCHKPGAEKKAKGHGLNDFGKVYHDVFKHKDFTAADKAMKNDVAMKIFKEAWEKSIVAKNADGKVYWDLIKEGKLPGKND